MAYMRKDGAVMTRVQPRNVHCPGLARRHRATLSHANKVTRPRRTPSGRSVPRITRNRTAATGSRACRRRTGQGHQVWLNRDPIGERGGLNLYECFANSPPNFFDPVGLSDCGPAFEKTLRVSPEMSEIEAAWVEGFVEGIRESLREDYGTAPDGSPMLGGTPPLPGGPGLKKLLPNIGQRLFGGGGLLNSNRYLRVGFGRDGGRRVFRIAGVWIGKIKKDPHIVIKDCGTL
jgi:hypothetical protein